MPRGAVIALSHGGGPLPLLDDPAHHAITHSLRTRVPAVLNLSTPSAPRAIIVVTAHWSTPTPTISAAPHPALYFDYHGFPPSTYALQYRAPGSPAVAREVHAALDPVLDARRGWDHGVFVPMMLVRPAADVAVVQLSVLGDEDPGRHYRMGVALRGLRESGVAVVGSGFASFHNLGLLFGGAVDEAGFRRRNGEWNRAVDEAVMERDGVRRGERLARWREFPGAWEMHPRGGGEHMMPLIVAAGAGGDEQAKSYTDEFMGLDMYSWYWE